jgi:1,4-alpha-glucan branching enzyme
MNKQAKEVGVVLHHDGVEFTVWAPFAESVALVGTFNNWNAVNMLQLDDGIYAIKIKDAKPGHEYKFVIDTGSKLLTNTRALAYTQRKGRF